MFRKHAACLPLLCVALSFVGGCGDRAAPQGSEPATSALTSSASSVQPAIAQTASAPSEALDAAAAFTIGTLQETDGDADLQGCIVSLAPVGATSGGDIFRESSSDADGLGFIRINGALIRVDQTHSQSGEHGVTRQFENADRALRIIETVVFGESNEATDSATMSGTLTISYKGATQTLRVEGGVAC
jgi:hypothetical protein